MTETTELIEYEPDIIEPPAGPLTLFGTSDPRIALERMAAIATVLVDVIDTKKLYVTINGRKHITVEGWTTLGGMTGVVPIVTGVRSNENGDGLVATVEARRVVDGMVVGAAEGECSRAEPRWKNRDPFSLRSMAQTRGISRALRAPLGMIVALAGYEASAAEEMPAEPTASRSEPERDAGKLPADVRPTPEQVQRINELLAQLTEHNSDVDWVATARQFAGVPGDMLTRSGAGSLIEQLEKAVELAHAADAEEVS